MPATAATPSLPAAGTLPITIILNAGSGHDDKDAVRERIEAELRGAGREFGLLLARSPPDVERFAKQVVQGAQSAPRMLVAAGGDGTINSVAAVITGSGLPPGRIVMGVLPMGTFNYFARDLGIPLDPAQAAAALAHGHVRLVHTATINGHLFLNNASFGLYRHLLEEREDFKQRWGRYKLVAVIAAIHSMWKYRRVYAVRMQIDGQEERIVRTQMLFFGLNSLQLEKLDLEVARCTQDGLIAVIALKPMSPWRILGTAVRGALQGLRDVSNLRCHGAARVQVDVPGSRVTKVAVDGESLSCDLPLKVQVRRDSLAVVIPDQPAERR